MGPNTAAVTGQYWAILIKSVCSPFFLSSKRREGNDLDVPHLKDFFFPLSFFFRGGWQQKSDYLKKHLWYFKRLWLHCLGEWNKTFKDSAWVCDPSQLGRTCLIARILPVGISKETSAPETLIPSSVLGTTYKPQFTCAQLKWVNRSRAKAQVRCICALPEVAHSSLCHSVLFHITSKLCMHKMHERSQEIHTQHGAQNTMIPHYFAIPHSLLKCLARSLG